MTHSLDERRDGAPAQRPQSYKTPDGQEHLASRVVEVPAVANTLRQEIMHLQKLLGVDPDGLIGPKTREAAALARLTAHPPEIDDEALAEIAVSIVAPLVDACDRPIAPGRTFVQRIVATLLSERTRADARVVEARDKALEEAAAKCDWLAECADDHATAAGTDGAEATHYRMAAVAIRALASTPAQGETA